MNPVWHVAAIKSYETNNIERATSKTKIKMHNILPKKCQTQEEHNCLSD